METLEERVKKLESRLQKVEGRLAEQTGSATTHVPDHKGLVLAALAAGKHIYCEWLLGRDSAIVGYPGARYGRSSFANQ